MESKTTKLAYSLFVDKPLGHRKNIYNIYMTRKIAKKKNIEIEAEEELNEDDKGPTILKREMAKAIKDMTRKMTTRDDNIPADLLKEL